MFEEVPRKRRGIARVIARRSVVVISGGTICPPAGSRCTGEELIAASARGFFAEVAVDSNGQLQDVIERDNATVRATPGQSTPSAPAIVPSDPPVAAPAPAVSATSAASPVPSAKRTSPGRG